VLDCSIQSEVKEKTVERDQSETITMVGGYPKACRMVKLFVQCGME